MAPLSTYNAPSLLRSSNSSLRLLPSLFVPYVFPSILTSFLNNVFWKVVPTKDVTDVMHTNGSNSKLSVEITASSAVD